MLVNNCDSLLIRSRASLNMEPGFSSNRISWRSDAPSSMFFLLMHRVSLVSFWACLSTRCGGFNLSLFFFLGLIRPRVAGAGFCQEPITVLEGSWSAGKFYGICYLECPSLHLLLSHPNGTAGFEFPFCAWFLLFTLLLLASTLLLVPWRLMDCRVLYVVMD